MLCACPSHRLLRTAERPQVHSVQSCACQLRTSREHHLVIVTYRMQATSMHMSMMTLKSYGTVVFVPTQDIVCALTYVQFFFFTALTQDMHKR